MTVLQKEINDRGKAINIIGYLMTGGLLTITAENESTIQMTMALMIEENERSRRQITKVHK